MDPNIDPSIQTYHDSDPNVIGEAINEGRKVVLISAPGDSLDWQPFVLFPTLDKDRVIVATPEEFLMGTVALFGESTKEEETISLFGNLLTEAIFLANEHFTLLDTGSIND